MLARLDPADVALQAEAATAAVAAAETEYAYAKAEFERYQNLFAQKFVSGSALDQKQNALNDEPGEIRAGEGAARGGAEPVRVRGRWWRRTTASSPRSPPRQGRSWRPARP